MDGFIKVVIIVCVVLGLPGVGKTHLKFLLLDKLPPNLRSSTICAEMPTRVICTTRIQKLAGKWKEVDNKEMLDVIARMILVAEPEFSQKPEKGLFSRITSWFQQHSEGSSATGAKPPTLKAVSKKKSQGASTSSSPTLSDTCQKTMEVIMDKLTQIISKLRSESSSFEASAQLHLSEHLFSSKWLYFTDSGGQPQYHELLPLFVHRVSSALCVIRLTDKLDEIQLAEYYDRGVQVGPTQLSQLSTKDTIQCLANTVQSYSTQDRPPNIIMVGTHLDKLEEKYIEHPLSVSAQSGVDTELEEKNKQLLETLKPDFFDQLVFPSSDMTKLLFPLNTLNPGEQDKAIAQSIRHAVETSGAKEVNIPIWWYIMELLLQELAMELGRGVLSRAECLEMARLLGIHGDAFNAALEFFDELNVIKYYPDVLPSVVFIESQIPLDKVSELVHHSFLLRQPQSAKLSLPVEGEWRHFRDRGVVSKVYLNHFSRHYVPGIFSVDDLCKLLEKHLVFAPIPNPVSTQEDSKPTKEEETYYVMPSLLQALSENKVASYRDSSLEVATLLVRFRHGYRRAGVFCCFVVHLIRHCGWSLLLDETKPVYRNCLKLRLLTTPPCTITLIDSNSYIEVLVKITDEIVSSESADLLNVIRHAILSGISGACSALNYKETKPELTFYCPHSDSLSPASDELSSELKQHTATLNDKRTHLCCDLIRDRSYRLQPHHLVWFGITQGNVYSIYMCMYSMLALYMSSELSLPTTSTSFGDTEECNANTCKLVNLKPKATIIVNIYSPHHLIWGQSSNQILLNQLSSTLQPMLHLQPLSLHYHTCHQPSSQQLLRPHPSLLVIFLQ